MPSGLGWVWSGCLALIASWLMTGCRLGNRLEYAEPKTLTGYYELNIQSLNFCATSSGTAGGTVCHASPTNLVPTVASDVFSNPIALQMINETTGEAMLIGIFQRIAADILVTPNTSAFNLGFTIPDPLIPYTLSGCSITMDWDGEGRAVKAEHRTVGNIDTKGHLELGLQVTTAFSGNCANLLAQLRNCFQSENQCGGSSASQNRTLFDRTHQALDPYFQAGVLTLNQIPALEALSFRLTY